MVERCDIGKAVGDRAGERRVVGQPLGLAGDRLERLYRALPFGFDRGEDGACQRPVGYEGGICLLYTSPSPRDRTRSRMPSSA